MYQISIIYDIVYIPKLPIENFILDDRFALVPNDTREQKRHAFLSSELSRLRGNDFEIF
ncbi:MAG: hypothetical protein ACYCSW_02740 [bacterium]